MMSYIVHFRSKLKKKHIIINLFGLVKVFSINKADIFYFKNPWCMNGAFSTYHRLATINKGNRFFIYFVNVGEEWLSPIICLEQRLSKYEHPDTRALKVVQTTLQFRLSKPLQLTLEDLYFSKHRNCLIMQN